MTLLAEYRGLGRVAICPSGCHVHMTVGPVTLCLELAAYQQLVVMLNESASNLELLREADRPCWAPSQGLSPDQREEPL